MSSFVSRFLDDARAIFEAAEAFSRSGQCVSDWTMLVGGDGSIRMLAACDWPLERLLAHHGGRAVFRVGEQNGRVRLEAREPRTVCCMESDVDDQPAAKRLAPSTVRALLSGAEIWSGSGLPQRSAPQLSPASRRNRAASSGGVGLM